MIFSVSADLISFCKLAHFLGDKLFTQPIYFGNLSLNSSHANMQISRLIFIHKWALPVSRLAALKINSFHDYFDSRK